MNQPVPEELISAYFDGEVTPEERRQVENLLESSPDLRQLLDDTSKLSALLHSFPRESAPAALAELIQNKVATISVTASPATAPRKRSMRREWTAFGAGMLVTMAALLAYVSVDRPDHFAAVKRPGLANSDAPPRHKSEVMFDGRGVMGRKLGDTVVDNLSVASESTPAGATADRNAFSLSMKSEGGGGFSERQESFEFRALNMNSDGVAIEPSGYEDFLMNLKNGDVVYQQIADPANAVAVGVFTVVDIDRGAEKITLLLQKSDLHKVEEVELSQVTERLAEPAASRTFAKRNRELADQPRQNEARRNKHDDLIVFYARAKGDQLEGTIRESLKEHPDLFQNFETQLPIGLPALATVNSVEDLSRDSEKDVKERDSAVKDANSVSAEANLAFNSYAISSGLAANTVTNLGVEEAKGKRDADNKSSPEGFATFRVELDSQKPPAQQQDAAKQNFGASNRYAFAGNNSVSNSTNFLQNSMVSQGGNSRLRSSRMASAAADQRDPRLVRMLIVLKPAAISPATSP